jgi:16S rRNA (guanosine(1370)-2'-O)-methyltransferase
MSMIRNKSTLERDNKILLEGARLIDDALETGLKLRTLLFSRFEQVHRIRNRLVMNEKAKSTHELIKIEHSDMKIWSSLTTSPGMIGIFDRPNQTLSLDHADLPITVICDQIREPSNLGSIIRVCASIPCQQIICTKGTADPWSSKCLRGGAGGHFRTPIKQLDWSQIMNTLPKNSHYFIAENNVLRHLDTGIKNKPYHDINLEGFVIGDNTEEVKSHVVVVIGGETHGVSTDAFRYHSNIQAPICIHIPLANDMDR